MFAQFTNKVIQGSLKCASYWQSMLRFGLPWTITYRGIHYLMFRLAGGDSLGHYPWLFFLPLDIFVMFVMSTVWWGFMREIVSWKRKV